MIRRPPRSTQGVSSAASDVYKRQVHGYNKYAEYILLNSPRIAPLRFHTRGYTGAKRQDQREYYAYDYEEIKAINAQILKLISSDLTSMKPYEFTHFVRGKLFAFVDAVFTSAFCQKILTKKKKKKKKKKNTTPDIKKHQNSNTQTKLKTIKKI
eukprot:TRINITY_DN23915_c0_g1_i1.p1 TRINITY_DN23915_c0_g1~~TRINITY_DN23915_c0_g1_i1.p1  ORF type:complete len:154 (+),score=39.06 TRINITY_DN23915_c0_g1_i1:135-596(+)